LVEVGRTGRARRDLHDRKALRPRQPVPFAKSGNQGAVPAARQKMAERQSNGARTRRSWAQYAQGARRAWREKITNPGEAKKP